MKRKQTWDQKALKWKYKNEKKKNNFADISLDLKKDCVKDICKEKELIKCYADQFYKNHIYYDKKHRPKCEM